MAVMPMENVSSTTSATSGSMKAQETLLPSLHRNEHPKPRTNLEHQQQNDRSARRCVRFGMSRE